MVLQKGLVTVVMIDDEDLRDDLSEDPDVTVVFQYKNIYVEISSTDEKTIIKQIAQSLPVGEIDPEKFKVNFIFSYFNNNSTIILYVKKIIPSTVLKQITVSIKSKSLVLDYFQSIRNKLRSCGKKSWVIYFPSKDDDNLLLHQFKIKYPDLNFGKFNLHLCFFQNVWFANQFVSDLCLKIPPESIVEKVYYGLIFFPVKVYIFLICRYLKD